MSGTFQPCPSERRAASERWDSFGVAAAGAFRWGVRVLVLSGLVLSLSPPIAAQYEQPLAQHEAPAAQRQQPSALIWVTTRGDAALVERVLGQVSDLDIALLVKHTAEAPPPVITDPDVFAVVWFTRSDPSVDRVVVHVSEAGDTPSRLVVRDAGTGAPAPDQELESATLETAALIVRAALRELASDNPAAGGASSEEQADPEAEPRSTTESRPSEHRGALLEAGWQLVLDGVGPGFSTGPELRVGASFGAFNLSAFATTSIPVSAQDEFGTMNLRRHSFAARGGYEIWLSRLVSLDLAVAVGAALHDRRVVEVDPIVSGAEDRVSTSLLVGPELRLGWRLGTSPVDLGLMAALYAVPTAPHMGYEIDGEFVASTEVWRVQPSFGVNIKIQPLRFW